MASDSVDPIEVLAPVSGKIEYVCEDCETIEPALATWSIGLFDY